jgi:hypothetical protein
MFESAGKIGIGTAAPTSKLDINAANALAIRGAAPFMTLYDTSAANQRAVVQSRGGGLTLMGDAVSKGTDPAAFVHMDRNGRLGLGTTSPQRSLQIGPSTDAMFTLDQSDGSPRAGFIRFGDKTGWRLIIGRSRESSGGPLNTGFTGNIFTIRDDGAIFQAGGYPLGAGNLGTLCRGFANGITTCPSSSLRYKTAISPYAGGLDVVEKLKPISFTRKESGTQEVGLGAEDVAALEPRLTYNNDDGEIEGVRYELLTTVLANAVKQQQAEIKQQRTLIEDLQSRLARLERAESGSSGR